jgi:hypothetical protein
MAKVITLARQFPSYHPKAGGLTSFTQKVCRSLLIEVPIELRRFNTIVVDGDMWYEPTMEPKHHTVRLGRRWKDGDMASLRVWSGKPYNSPQIKICEDVKVRVVDIVLDFKNRLIYRKDGSVMHVIPALFLANNDGLSLQDFLDWFKHKENRKKGIAIEAQILIWGDVKEY